MAKEDDKNVRVQASDRENTETDPLAALTASEVVLSVAQEIANINEQRKKSARAIKTKVGRYAFPNSGELPKGLLVDANETSTPEGEYVSFIIYNPVLNTLHCKSFSVAPSYSVVKKLERPLLFELGELEWLDYGEKIITTAEKALSAISEGIEITKSDQLGWNLTCLSNYYVPDDLLQVN